MAHAEPLESPTCPDAGQTFDAELGICTSTPTCPGDGIFNPDTAQCEVAPTCLAGGTFNTSTNQCETEPICDVGNYNSGANACKASIFCPEGYTISGGFDLKCVGPSPPTCPDGYSFNFSTGRCVGPSPTCPTGFFRDSFNRCIQMPTCDVGLFTAVRLPGLDFCKTYLAELPTSLECPDGERRVNTGGFATCRNFDVSCPAGSNYGQLHNVCIHEERASCSLLGAFISQGKCKISPDCGTGSFNFFESRCTQAFNCPSGTSLTSQFQCLGNPSCDAGTLNTSTDFCEADSFCDVGTLNPSADGCGPVGAFSCDLEDTVYVEEETQCHFIDTTPPTIVASTVELSLDSNGVSFLDPLSLNVASFDNVGIELLTVSTDTFGCDDADNQIDVTLTATDFAGNEAHANVIITIIDVLIPITMGMDISILFDVFGNASADASELDDGSNDNCEITNFVLWDPSNDFVATVDFIPKDLGPNNFDLFAIDASSNRGVPAPVTITVVDVTPPKLSVPADITVDATNPFGSVVSYSVSATDNVDPLPTVSCTPDSDSVFPLGTITVSCIATDSSGNKATDSFDITTVVTTTTFEGINDKITDLGLPKGIENSLTSKIDTALKSFDKGKTNTTINNLNAFLNEVDAQDKKKLSEQDADLLRECIDLLLGVLTAG